MIALSEPRARDLARREYVCGSALLYIDIHNSALLNYIAMCNCGSVAHDLLMTS